MQPLKDLIDLAQPVCDCVGFFCVKNTYVCEGINDKNNLKMSLNLGNVQLPS